MTTRVDVGRRDCMRSKRNGEGPEAEDVGLEKEQFGAAKGKNLPFGLQVRLGLAGPCHIAGRGSGGRDPNFHLGRSRLRFSLEAA